MNFVILGSVLLFSIMFLLRSETENRMYKITLYTNTGRQYSLKRFGTKKQIIHSYEKLGIELLNIERVKTV